MASPYGLAWRRGICVGHHRCSTISSARRERPLSRWRRICAGNPVPLKPSRLRVPITNKLSEVDPQAASPAAEGSAHRAPGIDTTTLADVEQYGVTRLLDELAAELPRGGIGRCRRVGCSSRSRARSNNVPAGLFNFVRASSMKSGCCGRLFAVQWNRIRRAECCGCLKSAVDAIDGLWVRSGWSAQSWMNRTLGSQPTTTPSRVTYTSWQPGFAAMASMASSIVASVGTSAYDPSRASACSVSRS